MSIAHGLSVLFVMLINLKPVFAMEDPKASVAEVYASGLAELVSIQRSVQDLHPLLQRSHPIVIFEDAQFYIFDFSLSEGQYEFVKSVVTDMAVPKGIRASFPLGAYDGRPSCIVTGEVFEERGGYATILHEFMHCEQFLSCENELKAGLSVAREAAAQGDYSWEINYPFPYDDKRFNTAYRSFLGALGRVDTTSIAESRKHLFAILSAQDYEYMVWQEWKEGFARYIENQIRVRLGLEENRGGREEPYSRVTFYEGGSESIKFLNAEDPEATSDLKALFYALSGLKAAH